MIRGIALATVLAMPVAGYGQGKLEAVRQAVDQPRSSDSAENSGGKRDSNCKNDSNDDPGAELLGELAFYAALAPFAIPNQLVESGEPVTSHFLRFPYASSEQAYLIVDRRDDPWPQRQFFDDRADTQPISIRASAELGSDFDGLTRTGLRLFLDTDTRFGIKSDWDYYQERLPFGGHDQLWFGDITPTFRFAQSEQIQMHTGLGARLMFDNGHDRGGFNFLYGFDAFPVKPLHLFGSFEAGSLGNAFLWRLHGGVGATWTRGELFAGYDYLNVGGAVLQGPMIGLRLWF
jgi:hypothetical protein